MFHPRVLVVGEVVGKEALLPVQRVALSVHVVDALATVSLKTFFTATKQAFLPEHALICGFEALLGSKRITIRVEKPLEDRLEHDTSLAPPTDDTPQLFSVILGDLVEKEEFEATIKYSVPLQIEDDELELVLHSWTTLPAVKIDSFDVKIKLSQRIIDVQAASSHTVEYKAESEYEGTATFHAQSSRPFSDFALAIGFDDEGPLIAIEKDSVSDKAALMMTTRLPADSFVASLVEVVYLVDRSGSMDEGRLEIAKGIFPCLLRKLKPEATFNVIGFGMSTESIFPEPVEATSERVEHALRAMSAMDGDLGDSRVAEALAIAVLPPLEENRVRHVVIVTDGEAKEENIEQCCQLAAKHASSTLISTIVIGNPQSQFLARSLARVSHGKFVVFDEDRPTVELREDAERLFDSVLAPRATAIKVEWTEGLLAGVAPFRPHPIVQQDALTLFAEVASFQADGQVSIKTKSSKGETTLEVPVKLLAINEGQAVAQMFAHHFLLDLDRDSTALSSQNGSFADPQVIEDKKWATSVTHGIPSAAGALSAIVRKEEENEEEQQVSLSVDHRFIYPALPKEEEEQSAVSSGSFWASFGFCSDSPLDKLLDSGEFTLEQLLDEEDVFSECQAANDTLVHFLTKKHAMKKIFRYVARPSVTKNDPQWQYIYLCTEVLVLPMWDEVLNTVYSDDCIHVLLDALAQENLDDQQIFRICRVLAAFMNVDVERFVSYLTERSSIVSSLVLHLDVSSVVDLIRALLKPEFFGHRGPVLEWLFFGGLFRACVLALRPSGDGVKESRIRDNATDLLTTLLTGARGVSLSVRPYEDEETIRGLFDAMFDEGGKPTSAFAHCIAALTGIVGLCRPLSLTDSASLSSSASASSSTPSTSPSSPTSPQNPLMDDDFEEVVGDGTLVPTTQLASFDLPPAEPHPTVDLVLARLPQLLNVFTTAQRSRLGSGGEITIAGQHVIQTIAFLESLVRLRIPAVDAVLRHHDVLRLALDALLRFPLNNFLHTAVEQLVGSVLTMPGVLRLALVQEGYLPNVIAEGVRACLTKDVSGYTSGQKAYGGHLVRMALALIAARHDPAIAALLDANEEWNEFQKSEWEQYQSRMSGKYAVGVPTRL